MWVLEEEVYEYCEFMMFRLAADMNIKIVRFSDVEKAGAAHVPETSPASSHNTAVICYSPMMATDQRPKGVVLTHQNILSGASACFQQLGGIIFFINTCIFHMMIQIKPLIQLTQCYLTCPCATLLKDAAK